jgi:hypothetical protein
MWQLKAWHTLRSLYPPSSSSVGVVVILSVSGTYLHHFFITILYLSDLLCIYVHLWCFAYHIQVILELTLTSVFENPFFSAGSRNINLFYHYIYNAISHIFPIIDTSPHLNSKYELFTCQISKSKKQTLKM